MVENSKHCCFPEQEAFFTFSVVSVEEVLGRLLISFFFF